MANYNELNALIDAYIHQNGVQAITGQILNGVLRAMVEQLGRGYSIRGAAQPADDPGTPDGPEAYFATTPGTYTNFGGATVAASEIALLTYDSTDGWQKISLFPGITSVPTTIDANVGTPAVTASYANGVLTFDFRNMKGETGDAAGFGTIGATVDANIGTPGVSVQTSGPDTAKNITFAFTNLKGETGVTSVVATVDNTSGNPQCAVSLNGQQLTLAFTGLKGAQGNTGSSVDYPFTIVNNLTTNDATQALSAAMGVQLEGEISQLEAEETKLKDTVDGSYLAENFTKEVVDFTTASLRNYLIDNENKYGASTSYKHAIINAVGDDVIDVTANGNYDARIAFVNNLSAPVSGEDVPVVTGTNVVFVPAGKSQRFIVPSGAVAVLVYVGGSGFGSAPSYMAVYRMKKVSVPGNKVLSGIVADGYTGSGATLSGSASSYGMAFPVKNGKVYLIDVSNAGTGTKYYGFLPMVAVGVTFTSRDTVGVANVHFVLTAPMDGYFLLTKSNNSFTVSVTELGIPIVAGDERDTAMALVYDKKEDSSFSKRDFVILEETGLYGTNATYKHILVPVYPGDYVKVKANDSNRSFLAFFSNNDASVSGGMPSYTSGTGLIIVAVGTTEILKVPSGASYLYVAYGSTGGSFPEFVGITSINAIFPKETPVTTRFFECMRGALSYQTGMYPSASFSQTMSHTPRFIKNYGKFKVLYEGEFRVAFYDRNQDFIDYADVANGPFTFERDDASFFRVWSRTEEIGEIGIESTWNGDDEVFQKLPTDEGYQGFGFGVNLNKGIVPNDTGISAITTGYVSSANFAVLHLPTSYKEIGTPTPLIIYLHGSGERYKVGDNRFGTYVRYSPEWDAMGFAQMDVDMIPEVYNTGTSTDVQSGTGDDAACVDAAYQWAIRHFNIRRDGVYLFGRSRGGQAVLEILGKLNQIKMPVVCALSNAGANAMLLYGLFRNSNSTYWRIFCESTGLDSLNPPAYSSGLLIANNSIVQFLRDNIDIWWEKAVVALRMCVDNPTEYQTPTQIFDLLVSSYNSANPGKTFIEDFIKKCKFRSPVPLRFDWCAGDTIQPWESTSYGNYGSAGKDGFVNNKLTGNAIYRRWPSCPEGENAHFHEMFNLEDYTLPNGVEIEDVSMAMTEWLLWAMGQDERFTI